jgi:A/G-specific adenine glycosylase
MRMYAASKGVRLCAPLFLGIPEPRFPRSVATWHAVWPRRSYLPAKAGNQARQWPNPLPGPALPLSSSSLYCVGVPTPHQREISAIVSKLLEWYPRNARDLPWRRTSDPYAIWVSEIMLQQTQVKTVIPYWERWMRSLPTIQALADARTDRIHKLWEGLGYYTRVRHLQKAARQTVAIHGGQFPLDYESMFALPGIGRYTAGAIASIAFNQPKPILDGNVIRVLTRLFRITANARAKTTNDRLWRLSEQLVAAAADLPGKACSHLNQALMELGALVCTPRQPKCPACPLRRRCVTQRTGKVGQLPNLGPRPTATSRRFAAFIVEHNGRYLVRQRPSGVVNAHLWEFPNVELAARDGDSDLRKAARSALGTPINSLQKLCAIKHAITRYRVQLDAFRALPARNGKPLSAPGQWRTLAQLRRLPFPSAHRRILDRLQPGRMQEG